MFWIVKGYLTTDEIAEQCYDGYVRRTWHNEESYIYEDGFEEAIVAGTDKAGLIKSPYKDIIVAPAAVAGRFVGVTVRDLTAGSYGWVQTAGMSVAKIDGTPAVGTLVGASSNHAGQLLAVGADTTPAIARLHGKAGVDNEYHTVFLMNLD